MFSLMQQPPDMEQLIDEERLSAAIGASLQTLPERQRYVLEQHMGLIDGNPLTLVAIGEKMGISPERVRQLEMCALRKLRHPRRAESLREFVGVQK